MTKQLNSLLINRWFEQLRQGEVNDILTQQIAAHVAERGGFASLSQAMTAVAPASSFKERASQWILDAAGAARLALASLQGLGAVNPAWQLKGDDFTQVNTSLGLIELVGQGTNERQIQVDVVRTSSVEGRIEVGIFPTNDNAPLDNVEVILTVGEDQRSARTNAYGKAVFADVALNQLDQAELSIAPLSTGT